MLYWADWLDYFGADAVGRLIGLWLRVCLGPFRMFFRWLGGTPKSPGTVRR
jgi:hypothetical protein